MVKKHTNVLQVKSEHKKALQQGKLKYGIRSPYQAFF